MAPRPEDQKPDKAKKRRKKRRKKKRQERLQNRAKVLAVLVRAAAHMEDREFIQLVTKFMGAIGLASIGDTPQKLTRLIKAVGKVKEDKLLQLLHEGLEALAPHGALGKIPEPKKKL